MFLEGKYLVVKSLSFGVLCYLTNYTVGTWEAITNGHLLFVMGALILQRAQKCEVRQVTKDVVKSDTLVI